MESSLDSVFSTKNIEAGLTSLMEFCGTLKIKLPLFEKPSSWFGELKKFDESMGKVKAEPKPKIDPRLIKIVRDNKDGLAELQLSAKQIRYLCWSECAYLPQFLKYLSSRAEPPSDRSIVGLIASYHEMWGDEKLSRQQENMEKFLRPLLSNYKGINRRLKIYSRYREETIGPKAADFLGKSIWELGPSIDTIEEKFCVAKESNLMKQAVGSAILLEIEKEFEKQGLDFVISLLSWKYLPKASFKESISNLILFEDFSTENQTRIKELVLKDERLGDPRRPENTPNWIGLNKAKERFIQLLSREDIEWFFDVVIRDRQDPHGRKPFWLMYVDRVLMSRVILSWEDYTRLRSSEGSLFQENQGCAKFARTSQDGTSAFILVFQDVVAIEYSRINNACYLYDKENFAKVVPNLWKAEFDSPDSLKQQKLAKDRISHHTIEHQSWQDRLRRKLAQCGVR